MNAGGIVLGVWLASGRLLLSGLGAIVGWSLVIALVVLSAIELYGHFRIRSRTV
jgi:hypothetical protein